MRRALLFSVTIISVTFLLLSFTQLAYASEATDIIKIKRDILISSDMTVNDAVVIYGNATVYGKVIGNLVVLNGDAYLKGNARVDGDVVLVGGGLVRESSASVGGKVTQISMPDFIPSLATFLKGGWLALWAAIGILALIGFLGIAILAAVLMPEHMNGMVNILESSFVVTFLWGVLGIMLIAPVAILLAISIVGIILIPIEIVIVTIAFIVGYVAAAVFIGKRIFRALKKTTPIFLDAVVGILVLYMVGFLPVLGAIIKAVFLVAGFGAVIVTRFGTTAGK